MHPYSLTGPLCQLLTSASSLYTTLHAAARISLKHVHWIMARLCLNPFSGSPLLFGSKFGPLPWVTGPEKSGFWILSTLSLHHVPLTRRGSHTGYFLQDEAIPASTETLSALDLHGAALEAGSHSLHPSSNVTFSERHSLTGLSKGVLPH